MALTFCCARVAQFTTHNIVFLYYMHARKLINGEEGIHHTYTAKFKLELIRSISISVHTHPIYMLAQFFIMLLGQSIESKFSISCRPVLNFAILLFHTVYLWYTLLCL